MKPSDFRSDTVTHPTEEMYRAMRDAPLGDDILGDDPTVRKLEALAAERTGKEAALFVPSGSMSNTIAIRVQTTPGDAVLLEEWNHSLNFEAGAPAAVCGVITRTYPSNQGVPEVDDVISRVFPGSLHTPATRLLVIENTHNLHGGAVVPPARVRELYEAAKERGLAVHLDGARLFNAAVALGVDAREITRHADTVNFCLSKGLSCPVGSLFCGPRPLVDHGRRFRKTLGGAMRQAGILAACGIVALETMIARLADDHRHARALAEGLARVPGAILDPADVRTNIVMLRLDGPPSRYGRLQEGLKQRGVLGNVVAGRMFRFVTHRHVGPADVERALGAVAEVVPKL
ncbi:MAG: aminotransferase class I/II-fold pyridoxal phosphate-dependent enzyme [Planctomycetes bacterium]|nr:aminotransferase class I/II-fold pyridoxal phosphate-dependent enzyme [Planctomycetota bacterium]